MVWVLSVKLPMSWGSTMKLATVFLQDCSPSSRPDIGYPFLCDESGPGAVQYKLDHIQPCGVGGRERGEQGTNGLSGAGLIRET